MNAMLFKHDSPAARKAVLRLSREAQPASAATPSEPSAEAREIARLEDEAATLRTELERTQAEWTSQLAAARADAKAEAAQEHVGRDEERVAALAETLTEARRQFDRILNDRVEPLAAQLAARAFAQLVALREGDADWLGQVIARRLAGVAADSVVALHIAPADPEDSLGSALGQSRTDPQFIRCDATLRSGTAKLVLRLGEIDIRPEEGASDILRLLEHSGGELG